MTNKKNLLEKFARTLDNIKTKKIKDFFESMGCEPLVILKTPRAGELVDNYHGIEFTLPEYALIHKGNFHKKGKYHEFCEFETKEGIEMMIFNSEGQDVQGLVNELKERDAYEVVYKK